jgi:outer membrane protein OmpA-like peptidoglycan-associated protein
MTEVDRAKVEKIAPSAYADADNALSEADAFVEQDPYDAEMIEAKATQAEFMSQRAMNIGESSRKFKEMSPEASALYLEGLLATLGTSLGTGDIRNQSVEGQINTLADAADMAKLKNQSLDKEKQEHLATIEDLEQQVAGLQGYSSQQEAEKQKLAAEREFNERFEEVQSYFRSDEAEVYKQKGNLVIRLKGIQFPVGKATLTPENYNLLSKVQRSIQTFDQPMKVTVEGHTDSTGSEKTNMRLSQERAEAVKTYLIANKTLPEDQLFAVGYGPDRPLAPNTTAKGRAINRRIDVVIEPIPGQ